MKKLICFVAILLAFVGVKGAAQEQSFPEEVTARELYVACSLLVTDNNLEAPTLNGEFKAQAPATCLMWSMKALSLGNKKGSDSQLRFCPNSSIEFQAGAPTQMAIVYMQSFEKVGASGADGSGLAAMIYAFKNKWPCED